MTECLGVALNDARGKKSHYEAFPGEPWAEPSADSVGVSSLLFVKQLHQTNFIQRLHFLVVAAQTPDDVTAQDGGRSPSPHILSFVQ